MSSNLLPPVTPEVISPRPTLVVAPHYDDEVLGCGGLLQQLVAAQVPVRILFLSDGSGGVEEVGDRDVYARRRRQEAEAATALVGVAGCQHLDLPDGALDQYVDALGDALTKSLLSFRPGLVLVPGPLEVSRDHRAAFHALGAVLRTVREGSPLAAATEDLTVLVYEVNHPAYPDVLVDVSDQVSGLVAAMACYSSQQERHDYLSAALGLRRYRALTLSSEVEAAEAYRRLSLDDFRTRSASRLVRDLGGAPQLHAVREGPVISVVVRTCNRPRLLQEALESIAESTYERLQVVLVNDAGESPTVPDDYPLEVARVELADRGGRAAAANAGIAAARGDFVCFLDDDDLVEPEHFAKLARLVTGAEVSIAYTDAAVGIYVLDGEAGWRLHERRLPYSRDFDPELLLLDNYIPFNTLAIARPLLEAAGPLDPELPFFEDWELLIRLAARAPFHHLPEVTCEYRQFRGGGHILGERPRQHPDFLATKAKVIARHANRLGPEVLARVVDGLRAEAVEQGEAARSLRQDRDDSLRSRATAEDRYHRLNGAFVQMQETHAGLQRAYETLLADHEVSGAEIQRLWEQESALRSKIDEDGEHIARLYAEIERLNGLQSEMRDTRAWRWHERIQRWRGK